MRRDFLWYGIAICWAVAAAVGLLRHHIPQAMPALLFAVAFALVGVWIGKRDQGLRQRIAARKQNLNS